MKKIIITRNDSDRFLQLQRHKLLVKWYLSLLRKINFSEKINLKTSWCSPLFCNNSSIPRTSFKHFWTVLDQSTWHHIIWKDYKKLVKIGYKNRTKMLNISRLICFTSKGKKLATIKGDITKYNKLKHSGRIMRRILFQINRLKLINMSLSELLYGCCKTIILTEIQIE